MITNKDVLRDAIRQRFSSEGPGPLAEEYGLSKAAILWHARKMGLKSKRQLLHEAVQERYAREGPARLAIQFDTSCKAIHHLASRLGVKREFHSSDEEKTLDNLLRERYPTEGAVLLEKELGIPRYKLVKRAMQLDIKADHAACRRLKMELSKARCRREFFQHWSADMAYVLGYIWADGNLYKNKSGTLVLRFNCHKNDREILEYVRRVVGIQNEIRIAPRKYRGKIIEQITLAICDQLLIEPLIQQHGLHPRKSFTNPPLPAVPDEWLPHFCRGYFDGDGVVHTVKPQGYVRIGFCGTPLLMEQLQDRICKQLGLEAYAICYTAGDPCPCAKFQWCSRQDVLRLAKWLYEFPCPFFLKRKHDKIHRYLVTPPDSQFLK